VSGSLLTFLSDFGLDDWFVGVVRGVILEICPDARIVDLSHAIPPGDVARGSFVLEAAAPDFPAGTIHIAVVDPGVGTRRRGIAVRAHGQLFVGPDNGVLEWAFADPAAEIHSLTETRFFREPVSRTFHGRDVFGPVAAHLARGVELRELGPRLTDPVRTARRAAVATGGEVRGQVMLVDRFGNALTNVSAELVARGFPGVPEAQLEVELCGRRIRGLSRSYGDSPVGALVALIGSSGRLEVAQVGGHAASRLGAGLGDPVTVRRTEPAAS
jgi:hypothetical protein